MLGGGGRVRLAAFWVHAWRRRDDVDIVCTTIRFGTPYGVETPRADVSTYVGCSWLVRNDVRGVHFGGCRFWGAVHFGWCGFLIYLHY